MHDSTKIHVMQNSSTQPSINDKHDCNRYSTILHSTTTATTPNYQPNNTDNGKNNNDSFLTRSKLTNETTASISTQSDCDESLPPLNSSYIKATTADKLTSNPQLKQWSTGKLTTTQLEAFAKTHIPTNVQTQLNQTFGKDTLSQSFYAEKCFRHVLLPVLKSGFLSRQTIVSCKTTTTTTKALCQRRFQTITRIPERLGIYNHNPRRLENNDIGMHATFQW